MKLKTITRTGRQAAQLAILLLFFLVVAGLPQNRSRLLGKISFPNSGAPQAQADFMEGVLFLHNFEYEDAARAFRRAQQADPNFALAYWGEAMTYNHTVWMQQDRKAALKVLRLLGSTPEERAAKAPTPREKAYLRAVEILFGATPQTQKLSKEQRDFRYRDEMRRLHETYPKDDEARVFYGLSILGTAHHGRDFATYMKAAAVLMPVWERNRMHPGAAHYLIHSFDDPIHAPLGLPMARAYSKIAPAAAHAQHMTSHIFVALGLWDDVVKANETARDVQNKRLRELGRLPHVCGHYTYWLEYGYLQQGRFDAAAKVLDACYRRLGKQSSRSERWYFSRMRARYVLDTGDWTAAERYAAPAELAAGLDASYHFTTAFAAAKQGNWEAARAGLAALRQAKKAADSDGAKRALILEREIEALLDLHTGNATRAVKALREAVNMEKALPLEFGPPNIVKPASELLGEVALQLNQPSQAVTAFTYQLKRTPRRTASLLGLARSAKAAGNRAGAADAYRRLATIWHGADKNVPGLAEAKKAETQNTPVR